MHLKTIIDCSTQDIPKPLFAVCGVLCQISIAFRTPRIVKFAGAALTFYACNHRKFTGFQTFSRLNADYFQ
jgi:hypothetical protein